MLAMEPPGSNSPDGIRDEKVKVLRAIRPLEPRQRGPRPVPGLPRGKRGRRRLGQVETFAAVRLEIDSWRWTDVPILIRAGKCLAKTATEVMVRFHSPPQRYIATPVARPFAQLHPNSLQSRGDHRHRSGGAQGGRGRGPAAGRADGQPAGGRRGAAVRPALAIGHGRRPEPVRPRRPGRGPVARSSSRCSATRRRFSSTSREAGDRARRIAFLPRGTSGTTLEAGDQGILHEHGGSISACRGRRRRGSAAWPRRRALAAGTGADHDRRPLQPPPLPALALPGGHRRAQPGRHRRADSPDLPPSGECRGDAGRRHRHRRDRETGRPGRRRGRLRHPHPGDGRDPRLFRPRRLGRTRSRTEEPEGCAYDPAAGA